MKRHPIDQAVDNTTTRMMGEWAEIQRVMALAEGDGWDDELPEELEMKLQPAAGGDALPTFRFATLGLTYSREPVTGRVIETRMLEDGTVWMRQYDGEGVLVEGPLDHLEDPRGD